MYSRSTFNITFEQLDLNENGKIDPGEIDESLEDQIKHRSIKGNINHSRIKLINLSSSYQLSTVLIHSLNFCIFIILEEKKRMALLPIKA